MTGFFVRVQRDDGSFANVEIDELTDTELERFIESVSNTHSSSSLVAWRWVKTLAKWIRDNVRETKQSQIDDAMAQDGR